MSRTAKAESRANSSLAGSIRDQQRTASLPRRYLYIVIISCLLVVPVAGFLLHREYREQLEYWQEKLTRVADANQRLLDNWVRERNEDAQSLAAFPGAEIATMSQPRFHTARPTQWQQHLQDEFNSVAGTYPYAGAYVLNRRRQVLAQSHSSLPLGTGVKEQVLSNSEIGSGPKPVTIPAAGDRADYSQVAFVAPIRERRQLLAKLETAHTIGYVVLLTRPEAVASLLLADRGATQSGETVLLGLQSGKPVFISPLRHWKTGSPLPLPPEGSPGRIALLERRDLFGAYRDYRGVPVLAATRFLPELYWAMVTKVDQSEALLVFRRTFMLGLAIALLSILTLVSVAAAWLRREHVQRLQLDLARGKQTEEKLRQSEERFWVALHNSPS